MRLRMLGAAATPRCHVERLVPVSRSLNAGSSTVRRRVSLAALRSTTMALPEIVAEVTEISLMFFDVL